MSLQCDNLSGELQDQWSSSYLVAKHKSGELLCPATTLIQFLSHLLIAGCDIGVQISVRPYVRSFVRPSIRPFVRSFVRSFVRPSTFTSKFSFLDIRDSCESETLHSNCP